MLQNLKSLIRALAGLGIKDVGLTKIAGFHPVQSVPSKYGFFNPISVSCGWISPDGKYFYNGTSHHDLIETAYRTSYQERAREIFSEQTKLAKPADLDYDDVVSAMYRDALNSGWVKVSNAYEIVTSMPTRESLVAFVDLVLSYDNPESEDKVITLRSGRYEILFSGTILELYNFARTIGR